MSRFCLLRTERMELPFTEMESGKQELGFIHVKFEKSIRCLNSDVK